MAVPPEDAETEYLIDILARTHSFDSTGSQSDHSRDTSGQQGVHRNSLLLTVYQTRSNRRQYLAHDEPKEDCVDLDKIEREKQERNSGFCLPVQRAAEVAAAARFISNIDTVVMDITASPTAKMPLRPRLGSLTNTRDSIFDDTSRTPRANPFRRQTQPLSKRNRAARPPPLELFQTPLSAEDVPTPLPTRTSSKGAPSFDIARGPDSAKLSLRSITSPGLMPELKTPIAILTPESANTFQFDFSFPPEPSLSRSASDATTDSQIPLTPDAEMADEELRSIEDRIRKDIEAFAMECAPFLRDRQQRTRKTAFTGYQNDSPTSQDVAQQLPPATPSPRQREKQEKADITPTISATEQHAGRCRDTEDIVPPTMQRGRDIFDWLQKEQEVEVDDLLDLYLSEEQKGHVRAPSGTANKAKTIVPQARLVSNRSSMDAG